MSSQKTVLSLIFLFLITVLTSPLLFSADKTSIQNILLITVDTLRADRISFYSDEHLQTPHMDRLAGMSWVFMRAFAHNPVTLPSHVNILTGTAPPFHGISDNAGYILEDRFLTVAEHLKERGFTTAAFIGAFPLDSRFGLDQGFDVYDDQYGTKNPLEFFYVERRAADVISPSIEWLDEQEDEWFCWIHLFDPHQPYFPPASYIEKFPDDLYSGEVAYVDDQLGRLFTFLEEEELFSDTCVILTSDHGEGLGEHGEQTHSYFAYNTTIHIPLILYLPGMQHRKIQTNVAHIDIFPAICDILGLKTPKHIQGDSLLEMAQKNSDKKRRIYFESLTPYLNRGWAPLKGYIEDDLKYIQQPIQEVYDLNNDFQETENLSGSYDLAELKNKLRALEHSLEGDSRSTRSRTIASETQEKLRSLGYLAGSSSSSKTEFTEKDDLKTLIPLQTKMLHGVALHQIGESDKAIEILKEVIAENPSFPLAVTNLSTIYQETGQKGKAIQVLREGLERNKDHLGFMSRLGILLSDTRNADEAISLLKRCTEMEDFNPEYWNYLGIAYFLKGQFQEARESYNKAISLDDDYALAYNNLGNIYLVVYLNKGDWRAYEAAVDNFRTAITLDPRLASAYNGLGVAYKKAGRVDDAISLWKKSLEFSPNYSFPLNNLGLTYFEKGNKEEALKYFMRYKTAHYNTLPAAEKERLDEYIRKCKDM